MVISMDALGKKKAQVKKPIPTTISAVAYISKDGFIRYCTSGLNVRLPDDFKEWQKRGLNFSG